MWLKKLLANSDIYRLLGEGNFGEWATNETQILNIP